MSKLSEILLELTTDCNLNTTDFAKDIGLTRSCVSNYLNNIRTPKYEHFIKLIEYFNCSADYMLGLSDWDKQTAFHPVPPFKDRLRALLREYGKTQEQFIEELPVSSSVLYKWLNGISKPSTDTLIRLATYFECSVDYLIGRIK